MDVDMDRKACLRAAELVEQGHCKHAPARNALGVGSPGWARTSDFLINSPTASRFPRIHQHLSARQRWRPYHGQMRVDADSSWCVGTIVEPLRAAA